MNLSKSIKVMCAKNEVQQKDLADYLGITNVYLSKIMNDGKVSTEKLQKMAAFFSVRVSQFVEAGE